MNLLKVCYYQSMEYREFKRQVGKAGLGIGEFAKLLEMHPNSVSNYSKVKNVPAHLAVIATLLAEMADNGMAFKEVLGSIGIDAKKARGNNKFGTHQ